MEIVHLAAPGPVGGAETVIATLTSGLAARGHGVRFCALLGLEPEPLPAAFAGLPAAGVEIVEVRVPHRGYRTEARRVAALLERARPAVLHTHGYHGDLIGWWAARNRTPAVSTIHGYTGGGATNRLYEWLDRRVLRRFAAVVAVSQPLVARLTADGIAPERVDLIPNALGPGPAPVAPDLARRTLGIPPGVPAIGWVGRLTLEKGPDLMIEAMTDLPGVHLAVVGDGPMRASLVARAGALGLGDRVHWVGIVPAASRLLGGVDIVVLSSRTEGTPMILLEAMGAGVPVVATRVGGIPDVVSDREAVLVAPERPEMLAGAIRGCLEAGTDRAALVAAARERVATEFGLDRWIDRHEALYRRIA